MNIGETLIAAGFLSVVAGVALVSVPGALITFGAGLLLVGIRAVRLHGG